MGRGSYLGGSTIIGPKSGWFSKFKRSAAKAKSKRRGTPHAAQDNIQERLQDALLHLAESDRIRSEKAARLAAEKDEKERLAAEERRKKIKEAKRKRYPDPSFYESVEVYKKEGDAIRPVRIGVGNDIRDKKA